MSDNTCYLLCYNQEEIRFEIMNGDSLKIFQY